MTNLMRGHWPSKTIFILAAIGSAAGLGNIWRFPFQAYDNGGAAFIIALIIANIIVGLPLLILETSLGQKTAQAAPDALAAVKKGLQYVGWFGVGLMALVMSYYMAVMAWSVVYLHSAFTLGWGTDTSDYFFNQVLQISSGPGEIGSISVPLMIGFVLAWVAVYFCIWKGVKSVSQVVTWTVGIPFVMLAILAVRAITLPGAELGLAAYLVPQWEMLLSSKLWLAAFSQVFFSLSLAFGIMIAYGSFNRSDTEIVKSALWIAVGNFAVSFLAGLAVFGTLGYMAEQAGQAVSEVVAGGPGLVFVTLPAALSMMPMAELFAVLFFVTIFLLAIDSAFSIIEGVATAIRDRMPHLDVRRVGLGLSVVLAVMGLPFITGAGLYYLDILDHFVVSYGIVLVGIVEAVAVGWLAGSFGLREYIDENSAWKVGWLWEIAVRYVVPGFLVVLLVLNVREELRVAYEGYPVWALWVVGVVPVVAVGVVGYFVDKVGR